MRKDSFPLRANARRKSVRQSPAICDATSCDTLPSPYHVIAAARRISSGKSSGAHRNAAKTFSGNSSVSVVTIRTLQILHCTFADAEAHVHIAPQAKVRAYNMVDYTTIPTHPANDTRERSPTLSRALRPSVTKWAKPCSRGLHPLRTSLRPLGRKVGRVLSASRTAVNTVNKRSPENCPDRGPEPRLAPKHPVSSPSPRLSIRRREALF